MKRGETAKSGMYREFWEAVTRAEAEAEQRAKLEAERKEREKIQARLDEQVRCPFCKKWFVPERQR